MEPNKKIDEMVAEIQRLKDSARKMAEEDPDVKSGKITVEDELQEPSYVLYQQITTSTAGLFQDPVIVNIFSELAKSIGEDAACTIMSLMAVMMTQSAHQAVLFYDDLLKKELDKQFNLVIQHVNVNTADILTFKSVLEVFKTKLDEISKKLQIDDIAKSAGMVAKPDPN